MVKFKCWIWRKAIKIHHELILYNELNRTIDYVCNICHTCLYFKSCADISMSLNLTGANVTPVSEWSNCLHERPLFLRILPRFEKIDENQFSPQIQCIQAVRDGPVAFGWQCEGETLFMFVFSQIDPVQVIHCAQNHPKCLHAVILVPSYSPLSKSSAEVPLKATAQRSRWVSETGSGPRAGTGWQGGDHVAWSNAVANALS